MKILLRYAHKGLFYAGPHKWTAEVAQAEEFESTSIALDKVLECRLADMEVVMHFDNPAFDIPLAVAGLGVPIEGEASRLPASVTPCD